MDKSYVKLFIEIISTTEILAERVMELNHSKNDADGEAIARIMRDDYIKLHDRMSDENFDSSTLTKSDYAKLLVGVLILINNIEDQIAGKKKAIDGYKTGIIPKLQRIVGECKTDKEVTSLALELFKSEESND